MHSIAYLPVILLLLGTAVLVVALFKTLKLSPVLGYLVAGAAIGPFGFGLIKSIDTSSMAEFGVVFLLFAIGLELTFERLIAMRWHVFGFGTVQVVLTGALIGWGAWHLLNHDTGAAIIIGGALALSSTAIVLQVLSETGKQSSHVGRLSLANLLMQDFAVVPLLVLVPLLADKDASLGSALGMALIKALVAMAGIFIIGRLLLRPLFRIIGQIKSEELFVATTLLIALGAAWTTEHFGLSLALGAFLAGLLVAETEYQHRVEDTIVPFKGLFMGLFFMTVGMSIDLQLIAQKWEVIALLCAVIIFGKSTVIILLSRLFRFRWGTSIHTGLLLSQGSEFAFILFGLASTKGLIAMELSQILLLVVTITMALTPLLSMIGNFLGNWVDKRNKMDESVAMQEVADLDNHIIIGGFGHMGRMVARMLTIERVNYIALDMNAERVSEGRSEGYPVYKGDASRLEALQSVGMERAAAVILTIPNEVTLRKAVKTIREHLSDMPIIVRAKNMRYADVMKEAGADVIVPETYETALQLGATILKAIGISEFEISRLKNRLRSAEYSRAKDTESSSAQE